MSNISQIKNLIISALRDVDTFVDSCSQIKLRDYQKGVAQAVVKSVLDRAGRSFVIMFPRQSGKNELQAQLETYLLTLFYLTTSGEMVKISPTWKPQTLNAMRRLERVLSTNHISKHIWTKESGYIFRCGSARIYFFSGQPRSNIVGATASILLEVDEAQDVMISKFDKDIAPMAASTNATRVFWGTAWTSRTLLARELRAATKAQKKDGIKRVFILTADDVAKEVPAYGVFVAGQVARLGRNHPMIKTQYFSEEIDAEGGLFPPERCALMQGAHAARVEPEPDKLYAAALDLAGEDEAVIADPAAGTADAAELSNPKRDSTALTIFEVDLSTVDDPLINKPTYKVIFRKEWIGTKHAKLYGDIKAIANLFDVRFIAVDSTGVGAGMASFLSAALGDKVLPFEFNTRTKSDLLWDFLGIIDSGRFKDYQPQDQTFWQQIGFCEFEILEGPQKRVRWGVPDGTRDAATGQLVHDDLLISAAMCSVLDQEDWSISAPTFVIQASDPLDDLDKGF
ncbi:MAG: hypothetical protein Q7J07_07745 [Pelolinea sp.]|nr:hypothetical protein [Pelolinea sp.]